MSNLSQECLENVNTIIPYYFNRLPINIRIDLSLHDYFILNILDSNPAMCLPSMFSFNGNYIQFTLLPPSSEFIATLYLNYKVVNSNKYRLENYNLVSS